MMETSVVPVIYAAQRATRSSSSNTKYVIPRCKPTTYQQSFIIRACRLWNALVDELNFDTDNIGYFKRILLSYYHNSLTLNYDSENPRTFKSICLKCNLVRSLEKPISCCYQISLLDFVICLFVCLCVNVTCLRVFVCYVLTVIVAILSN